MVLKVAADGAFLCANSVTVQNSLTLECFVSSLDELIEDVF